MRKMLVLLLSLASLAGCVSYSFDVKEDRLSRSFMREKFGNKGSWMVGFVPDKESFARYTNAFRAMIRKYPVMGMTDAEADARLKDFVFKRYQYLFFGLPSSQPVVNLYENYRFTVTDNAGEKIGIREVLYLTADNGSSADRFSSYWIIGTERPLTRDYFTDRDLPFHLTVTDPNGNDLEILIGIK